MSKITYNRGTTYRIAHTFTAPTYLGVTLYFTVKTVPYDTDAADTVTSIFAPKNIAMSGSSFPQTTTIIINPEDVADTVKPGKYFYDIKVEDTNTDVYLVASGDFILDATPTNRAT